MLNSNKKAVNKTALLAILMSCIFVLTACGSSISNESAVSDNAETTEKAETSLAESNVVKALEGRNVLIAYYSYSGKTKEVAEQIGALTGGDLAEIERVTQYEKDTFTDVAEAEIQNGERPEIAISLDNLDAYDVVMVGYPIWYEEAPAVIASFLESFDFKDKTIVPFCTSSSDKIDSTLHIFSELCPDATISEALTANSEEDIEPWLDRLGILQEGAGLEK